MVYHQKRDQVYIITSFWGWSSSFGGIHLFSFYGKSIKGLWHPKHMSEKIPVVGKDFFLNCRMSDMRMYASSICLSKTGKSRIKSYELRGFWKDFEGCLSCFGKKGNLDDVVRYCLTGLDKRSSMMIFTPRKLHTNRYAWLELKDIFKNTQNESLIGWS